MPGQKPQSVSTDLSLGRALLRAIALKMAGWSNAILKKLATDNPAASPDPTVDTADVHTSAMDNAFAGPVISQGPPKHWIERVRQGAPKLLRPAPRPGNRPTTPAPDASAIAPPAAEGKVSPLQAEATSPSKPTGPKPPARRLERPGGPVRKEGVRLPDRPAAHPACTTHIASAKHSFDRGRVSRRDTRERDARRASIHDRPAARRRDVAETRPGRIPFAFPSKHQTCPAHEVGAFSTSVGNSARLTRAVKSGTSVIAASYAKRARGQRGPLARASGNTIRRVDRPQVTPSRTGEVAATGRRTARHLWSASDSCLRAANDSVVC